MGMGYSGWRRIEVAEVKPCALLFVGDVCVHDQQGKGVLHLTVLG
jgi:hypothetical protein